MRRPGSFSSAMAILIHAAPSGVYEHRAIDLHTARAEALQSAYDRWQARKEQRNAWDGKRRRIGIQHDHGGAGGRVADASDRAHLHFAFLSGAGASHKTIAFSRIDQYFYEVSISGISSASRRNMH